METVYELKSLTVRVEREKVLRAIDCFEDSPVYEMVAEEYEAIRGRVMALAKPVGAIGFGKLPEMEDGYSELAGRSVLYAVVSMGRSLSEESSEAFGQGEYVRGMLFDAIADEALFSVEDQVIRQLKDICAAHGIGIARRLEAPHDISMRVQKAAWEQLALEKRFGIGMSEGYMFDPVKTSCQVFLISEDPKTFRAVHDCRNCPNNTCKRRHIPEIKVKVCLANEERTISLHEKESLLAGLVREGYDISAPCGGSGRCGKCGIRLLAGGCEIKQEDRKVFTEGELENGWRLACRMYPEEDIVIALGNQAERDFEVVSAFLHGDEEGQDTSWQEKSGYAIAVDIGTTTLALQMIRLSDGRILHTVTRVNSQRKYGGDVITRMKASMDGKKQELQQSILSDLQSAMDELLFLTDAGVNEIAGIVISGNTTMGHLLLGYDCSGLGVYPFIPVDISLISGSADKILGIAGCQAEAMILPGISTYVGGDIVAGLYACEFDRAEEVCFLIDLGTNGEMAIGNKDRILVTSTAAGPAFEGGNISCGMASVAGAVYSVVMTDGESGAAIKTIQDKEPRGLCGTGVIETVSELVRIGMVEESGLLDETCFEQGVLIARAEDGTEIRFTQKDVREMQLAKAAVRAGIETLLLKYGVGKPEIDKVYLAGGFGCKLDSEKAILIGLLPEEFRGKLEPVGNSSLAGAVKYSKDDWGEERIQRIIEVSEEISLAADKDFQEIYMEEMFFCVN